MEYTNKKCDNCEIYEKEKMDILFKVMDNENDVTLTDGEGIVIRVSDSYEKHYGVTREEIIGKSIFSLENMGVFKPSVTAVVLEKKRKATILQKNKMGDSILTTGVPIFDDSGNIQYVISFNSIDIADMTSLNEKYIKLIELMSEYNAEINQLQMKEINEKELVTNSMHMTSVNELISQIADTNANVLLTGETGVGKSMIARIIHQKSGRVDGPFIEINCGTIPENLIESELFGYEKGSFTGASAKGKMGKIELANGGTLFLDEIGELPLNMQVKLLQVIQEKVIIRIGGLEKIDVDFRLITATNLDLKKNIRANLFREDLYYRLNVIPIQIQPLRERPEDIVPLVQSFLDQYNKKYKKQVSLASEVYDALVKQKWPGNIRQIENFVERLVIIAKQKEINLEDLPDDIVLEGQRNKPKMDGSLDKMLEEYEKTIIVNTFKTYKTSIAVGEALGISQATAARRLRKYIPNYKSYRYE
ncbi:MAG: sigma 54-interacting transcriptional regulator [Eubacteriales bacterium]|nr:sigma 54-interacting transcriptional regulator [Eubacteriales bacterium]MDD3199359.1 sigma 54-interacting transcriptional regulator [Eubacteriales bacterium]MDD4121865.1 sigma 54-interacting transcriptional regulator [Eubacteriales bacterium]MDD4629222.1 sigma 54-interacting transcriptional regulator [Eubacteriales bacterium]